MPFAFILVGTVLVISGVRGTSGDLLKLLKGDLTGANGFVYWILAILLIGSLGYIPAFKKLSVTFLTLVLIVLVLKEGNPNGTGGGFFQQFQTALTIITNPNSASINPSNLGGA